MNEMSLKNTECGSHENQNDFSHKITVLNGNNHKIYLLHINATAISSIQKETKHEAAATD